VLVVVDLNRRIDAAADVDVFYAAVLARDLERQILLRLDVRIEAYDVVGLGAIKLEALRGRAVLELQRQHAHADEVAAVDAFEALRHDGFHAEKVRAFRRPVAG